MKIKFNAFIESNALIVYIEKNLLRRVETILILIEFLSCDIRISEVTNFLALDNFGVFSVVEQ